MRCLLCVCALLSGFFSAALMPLRAALPVRAATPVRVAMAVRAALPVRAATPVIVRVDVAPAHRIRSFRPLYAIGSTVDKEPAGSIPQLYSVANVRAILAAGLGWLSYRLFTELSVQDWHWNPAGRFSAGTSGYWTSDVTASGPIRDSFGYRLPHRGATSDQGNNEGYSRLDDGDLGTYWKSNPYLTRAFTGESDARHAQWAVVDLQNPQVVDAIRIAWANPYAVRYRVAWWTGGDAINDPGSGRWTPFARGDVAHGAGGTVTLRLARPARRVRFIRIEMAASSNTCDTHGNHDKRNCVGYAIREIGVGRLHASGRFEDLIVHRPCGGEKPGRFACGARQTAAYVSSVDPWHAATDRVRNQEQPGLDLIARSGLARSIGAMYPVPMLYSTPENAVAEVRYLEARGYPIQGVELGEEPDGQYAVPEDYAALYLQWAKAIHAVDPRLKLGGPVFSGVNADLPFWPDARGNVSWLNRFLRFLRDHGREGDLAFMSFEHYPFDGCENAAALQRDLLAEPQIVASITQAWRRDGLPASIPMYISEANISAVNFTQAPMQIEGGLWLVDYLGSALSDGVTGAVYYQDEPVPLSPNRGCPGVWGNLTMFAADGHARIRARTAQFYAAQMLTQVWLEPGDAMHELYAATTTLRRAGGALVSAYPVKRPDGTWSIVCVNKDTAAHAAVVRFVDRKSNAVTFGGMVERTTFGPNQYVWRSRGRDSLPSPNRPPASGVVTGGAGAAYELPARSITVLRGRIGASVTVPR